MTLHPRPDEHGRPLRLHKPSQPSPLGHWHDPVRIAAVVPEGPLPPDLNSIPLQPWREAPSGRDGWLALAQDMPFEAPRFDAKGLEPAAGTVVVEPDGRVWLVAPSNAFGGYVATFPKGKAHGLDLRATALKETYEESGLKVELLAHLVDSTRSSTRTRYFLARRLGGSPAAMGWESQAVLLAPLREVKALLNRSADHAVVDAIRAQFGL